MEMALDLAQGLKERRVDACKKCIVGEYLNPRRYG
jgi:hypothetical protein